MFDYGASHSFIDASCVNVLVLKVESLEKPLHVSSPIGVRVRIDQICRDCDLEISGIVHKVELRVMDISDFYVILAMHWLTAHRVVIDCDRRRVTAYAQDGIHITFQGDKHDALPRTVYDSRWHGQVIGWLVSLTLEDEAGQGLSKPWVVCEFEDVFPDELPELPP